MNVMLENLMLLGIYGIEVVKFVIGTRLVLKEKEQKVWMYLVGLGVAVGYVVWAGVNSNSLFIYALVICSTYFSVGGKWFDRLIKVLLLALLVLSLDEIAAGITREFVNRNEIFDELRFVAIFLDTFWGLLITLVIFFVKKDSKKTETVSLSKRRIFIIIILNGLVTLLAIAMLNYSKIFVTNKEFQILATILVSMAYMCMSLLCWLLVYFRGLNEETRRALNMEREMNVYRSNYYKKIIEKDEETRKFRHDINNHFMYLTSLAYVEDINGIRNYLRGLNQQILKIQKSVFITGNDLFDVILNEKLQGLNDKIKVLVTGKAVCEVKLDEVDMCTIFANLIDNAVEAVEHIDKNEAYIAVNFRKGYSFLKITIRNSFDGKIKFDRDGLPKTTKNDGRNHGMGLSNVRETVEKYSGEFEWGVDGEEFWVEVTLPIKRISTDQGVK